MSEEPEQSFEDKVKKFALFGNLEGAKRAFVANDFETFENELKLAPYQYFRVRYEGASDFNGSPSFVVKNFVTGLVNELMEKYAKYFFNVYRCVQPTSEEKVYVFESLWIVNTPEFGELYGSRKDDFVWTQVDSTNDVDFSQFLLDFRRIPVPEVEEEIVVVESVVYEEEEPYDPFSFGGYDDEDEQTNEQTDNQTVVEQANEQAYNQVVDDQAVNNQMMVRQIANEQIVNDQINDQVNGQATEQIVNDQVNDQVNNQVIAEQVNEPKLNVLISEQYLH